MRKSRESTTRNSEGDMWVRILQANRRSMTASMAKAVLTLHFSEADHARMHELAVRNQAGDLSSQERDELFDYAKVGNILSILHSQARVALKKKASKISA